MPWQLIVFVMIVLTGCGFAIGIRYEKWREALSQGEAMDQRMAVDEERGLAEAAQRGRVEAWIANAQDDLEIFRSIHVLSDRFRDQVEVLEAFIDLLSQLADGMWKPTDGHVWDEVQEWVDRLRWDYEAQQRQKAEKREVEQQQKAKQQAEDELARQRLSRKLDELAELDAEIRQIYSRARTNTMYQRYKGAHAIVESMLDDGHDPRLLEAYVRSLGEQYKRALLLVHKGEYEGVFA